MRLFIDLKFYAVEFYYSIKVLIACQQLMVYRSTNVIELYFTYFRNSDGESMSRTWAQIAKKLDLDTSKLSAIETDGEYLKNEVPFKFLQHMDENTEECHNIPYILGPGNIFSFLI